MTLGLQSSCWPAFQGFTVFVQILFDRSEHDRALVSQHFRFLLAVLCTFAQYTSLLTVQAGVFMPAGVPPFNCMHGAAVRTNADVRFQAEVSLSVFV